MSASLIDGKKIAEEIRANKLAIEEAKQKNSNN